MESEVMLNCTRLVRRIFPFLLIVTLTLAPTAVTANRECPCSYGGPCLRRSPRILCPLCSSISDGFYENCTQIKNHCDNRPCTNNGTCVPTFGGYYCKCPPNYYGMKCDVHSTMELSRFGVTNEVYVYYQVQPRPDGTNMFYVIHDIGDRDRIYNETEIFVRARVTLGGDQFFYPLRGREYLKMDVKQKCKSDTESNSLVYDGKVCEYLPDGEVWAFKFDSTLYGTKAKRRDVVWVRILNVLRIGRTATVSYDVQAISKTETIVIFSHEYRIFTYSVDWIPHNCLMNIRFRKCSTELALPYRISLAARHPIKSIHEVDSCQGVKGVSNWWYLQRNISSEVTYDLHNLRDDVPVLHGLAKNSRFFILPSLNPGVHMISYALRIRGVPPFYGGSKEFTIYSHCYVETMDILPNLGIDGGENRTVSCYETLMLDVVSRDNNFSIQEFLITVNCNETATDPECFKRKLEGSIYKKRYTPCKKTYRFEFVINHKLNLTEPIHLFANIEFIDSYTSVTIHCLYNCYPINPTPRMLAAARTNPYAVEPVTWTVLRENNPVNITFSDRDAFDGISRIIRMNENLFQSVDAPITNVIVSFEKGTSRASAKDVAYNLAFWNKQFILGEDSSFPGRYNYTSASGKDPFENDTHNVPMEFWVYSIKQVGGDSGKILREVLLEQITTHFGSIVFHPHYNKVILCLTGPVRSKYAQACKLPEVVEPNRFPDFFSIVDSFNSGHTGSFFEQAHFFLIESVVESDHILRWQSSVNERLTIIRMILKVGLNFETDVYRALSTLIVLFFSEDGSSDQNLPTFVEDRKILSNFALAAEWLNCNHYAIRALRKVVKVASKTFLRHPFKLKKYPFEDIPSLVLRSWTLAYFQDGFLREKNKNVPRSIHDMYLFGEVEFYVRKNSKFLISTIFMFSEFAAVSSPLFYGLRRAGKGSVRAWFARSSYRGLQSYTNKSRPWNVTSNEFAEYFFGPEMNDPKDEWINLLVLELFEPIDDFVSREFSLVVVAVKPRHNDSWLSPRMLVDLRGKDGRAIRKLPGGEKYRVSLPAMRNGSLVSPDYRVKPAFEIDVPLKPGLPAYKYITAYKINVPANVQSTPVWTLYIYYNKPFELRVKAFFDRAPEVEEVKQSPLLASYWASNVKRHCIEVEARAEEGKFIPNIYYLGIYTNESLGVLETNHFTTSCQVRGFRGPSDLHYCISIFKGADKERERAWNRVPCNCSHFGLISTVDHGCFFTKILLEPITFIYPRTYNIGGIVSCLVLLFGGVLLVVYAVLKEKTRDLKKTLLFAEDCLPTDTNYLVLGVYTGTSPMAGTLSTVAIKITGSDSSSRVHLLKSKVKTTLKPCIDAWFIIPTPAHVGTVKSVTMWSNYRLASDWYCSKLMIYDLTRGFWYKVKVEQWLRILPSNEDSQVMTFVAYKVDDMVKEVYEEDTFSYYFTTELCNTHLPASLFYLNTRSMASFEMRAITYMAKIYAVVILTWAMQEYVGYYILDKGDLYPSKLTVFNANILLLIFLITLATRLLTWPMRVWFRTGVVSRMVQRKTTSPNMFFMPDVGPGTGPGRISKASKGKSFIVEYQGRHGKEPEVLGKQELHFQEPHHLYGRIESSRRSNRRSTAASLWIRRKSSELLRRSTTLVLWSKSPWFQEHGRNLIAVLAFGPSQFRCVNVTKAVFGFRTKHSRIAFRIVIGALLIGMLAFIAMLELFTLYWLKTRVAAFLVTTALFFDAVVIEPVLIFLRCLVGYSFFRMRNEETHLWDNEETNKLLRPKPLSYTEYVEKTVSKEYKPLTTDEIEKKRRSLEFCHFYGQVAFLLMMLVACSCAYLSLISAEKQSVFYSVKTNRHGFSAPSHSFVPLPVKSVDDVVDPYSALDYISSVVAESDLTWYNAKFISKDRSRWGKDHRSRPLGSTNVLVLVMSDKAGKFAVPLELGDYFHAGRVWGGLDYGYQETEPIFIGSDRVFYNVTDDCSSCFILGKSLEVYPMAGHVVQIVLQPWLNYYIQIRDLMYNIVKRNGSFIPRALIFTTNYFNPNLPNFVSIDVIIELQASGICSARVQVNGSAALKRDSGIFILWRVMAAVTVILFFINVIIISKHGLKSFLTDPAARVKGELFLACFVKSLSSSFYRTEKAKLIQQVANDPSEVYSDFHALFQNDMLDDGAEAAMIFFTMTYMIIRIKFHLSKNYPAYSVGIATVLFSSFLVIGFTMVFLLTEYEMLHKNELRIVPLVSYFGLKEFFPINSRNWQYADAAIWPCFGFMVLLKVCTAYIIFQYRRVNPLRETLTDALRRSRKYTPAETPPPASPKFSQSIRASVKSLNSVSPSKPPSPERESSKSKSPSPDPMETMMENLRRKFIF